MVDDAVVETPDETDETPDLKFWISQLDAAKKATEPYFQASEEAWREYLGHFARVPTVKSPVGMPDTRFPLYWSSVRTIQPALYSRTPITTIEKTFEDLDDNTARLAAISLERLGKYLVRSCPFDRVQYSTRDDYINTGRCTNRVCFDADIEETPSKRYYTQQETQDANGQPVQEWLDSEGQPPAEGAQLQEDEAGTAYTPDTEEELRAVRIELLPVSYADILHTPNARHWEELDWLAFKSLLTKEDCEKRFGEEVAANLPYEAFGDPKDKENKDLLPQVYAKIWEIWDKRHKQVYWHCEGHSQDWLDIKDDPYELIGFFPCPPFMLGTVPPTSLYPVPDYIQLRPLVLQLHAMAKRLKTLVRAARRRGLYDSSIVELAALGNDADEAEYIGVNAFEQQIVSKGGIANVVQHFPMDQIVEAINQMVQIIQVYKDEFNEIWGIPDILRGVSDPSETAAAQQLKGQYLSLRFSAVQREFQRLVRDDIELMIDLSLKKFPDQKLAEICGVEYWKQEDQPFWPSVVALLRDDVERKVRIDIETDSTITMNQNADIEQRNYLAQTVFNGLAAVATAQSQDQDFSDAAMELMLYVVTGLRQGKQIEEKLRAAMQKKQQAAQQPQQPPPPDPAMVKAQGQIQVAQAKAQTDGMLQKQKLEADMQRENVKAGHSMQLEYVQLEHDRQLAAMRAQIDQLNASLKMRTDSAKAATDVQATQAKAQSEVQAKAFALATKAEVGQAFDAAPPEQAPEVHIHTGPEVAIPS